VGENFFAKIERERGLHHLPHCAIQAQLSHKMVANNYEILPGAGIFSKMSDSDSSMKRALITI
jgi:hypothetical protein